jgi:carbonic anhydrase
VIARLTPAEALELLRAGNERFVAGTPHSEPFGPNVADFAGGQNPFAVVLGCSDSRVPIESIFDQVPGNVFVVRVAGNFVNDDNLGSIEFAVDLLKARLVVVLGHTRCGAVMAALSFVREGARQSGHVQNIVEAVASSVRAARKLSGDWLEQAIAQNVSLNVAAITTRSKIVAQHVHAGEVQVIGGVYNVLTGRVAFA